jgi:serine/threonine protein kinase
MNNDLPAGSTLSHYRIVSKIGAGGMGEVYLAQDTKLDRKIALKILPAEVAAHPDRMKRFVQEAKTASALNHPNIITIHEIDQTDSGHFIAIEFVDGETLRQQLNARHTKIAEALDIGLQIASALSAAHAAGIIHRDIKPENVMIRRDGIVKVLDFGLAKLSEQVDTGTVDAEAVTQALVQTEPGVVLGTAAYMSPEQARGLAVDARTDIFSLGVVIYEIVAGQAPFGGATRGDLMVALLQRDPPPLSRFTTEAPAELERLVMKTLAKDRDERYQTAKDLLIDLKRLKQKLEVDAEIERAAAPERNDVARANKAPGTTANATIESVKAQAGTARPASSAGYIATEIKRHKKGVGIIFAALVVALSYGLYKFASQKRPATSSPEVKMARLASTGKIFAGLISPDGKHLVYGVEDAGKQSIWVRQVAATSSNVQIVPLSEATYANFRFTGDGNYLYFNRRDKNGPDSLYQMPALGGMARKISENVSSRAALSPDGSRIAFIRGDPFDKENSLVVANSDGSGEQPLTTRQAPDNFAGGIAWPPDGKSITCVAGEHAKKLIEVPLDGGPEKLVKTPQWFAIGNIEWLPDASGLIVIALEQSQSSPPQIWHLSYPSGEARRITNDFSDYTSLSHGGALSGVTNLWIQPLDGGPPKQLTNFTSGTFFSFDWSPDGKRLVYGRSTTSSDVVLISNFR